MKTHLLFNFENKAFKESDLGAQVQNKYSLILNGLLQKDVQHLGNDLNDLYTLIRTVQDSYWAKSNPTNDIKGLSEFYTTSCFEYLNLLEKKTEAMVKEQSESKQSTSPFSYIQTTFSIFKNLFTSIRNLTAFKEETTKQAGSTEKPWTDPLGVKQTKKRSEKEISNTTPAKKEILDDQTQKTEDSFWTDPWDSLKLSAQKETEEEDSLFNRKMPSAKELTKPNCFDVDISISKFGLFDNEEKDSIFNKEPLSSHEILNKIDNKRFADVKKLVSEKKLDEAEEVAQRITDPDLRKEAGEMLDLEFSRKIYELEERDLQEITDLISKKNVDEAKEIAQRITDPELRNEANEILEKPLLEAFVESISKNQHDEAKKIAQNITHSNILKKADMFLDFELSKYKKNRKESEEPKGIHQLEQKIAQLHFERLDENEKQQFLDLEERKKQIKAAENQNKTSLN